MFAVIRFHFVLEILPTSNTFVPGALRDLSWLLTSNWFRQTVCLSISYRFLADYVPVVVDNLPKLVVFLSNILNYYSFWSTRAVGNVMYCWRTCTWEHLVEIVKVIGLKIKKNKVILSFYLFYQWKMKLVCSGKVILVSQTQVLQKMVWVFCVPSKESCR